MFELLEPSTQEVVEINIEGQRFEVPAGITVAAAVLLYGLESVRATPVSGSPRLPLCMMGVCYDCLMDIDGLQNQRACQVQVQAGMRIERAQGVFEWRGDHEAPL